MLTSVKVAVEVLYAILSRQYNPHFYETWSRIVLSTVRPDRIQLLKSIHLASQSPPEDIDDVKYTLQKKLSEVSYISHRTIQTPLLTASGTFCAW